jgi:YidC/Oxa1 family membrane protein insertase
MFTITDRVVNKSAQAVTLYPYAAVARQGDHTTLDGHVILEGGIGVLSGTVEEFSFSNLTKELKRKAESPGGWIGMTDKYWLTAIIPPQDKVMRVTYSYDGPENPTPSNGHFQSDYRGEAVVVKAGGDAAVTTHFFAGAKLLKTLDGYAGQYNIPHFDKAIHFGWFYFLTKPFLYVLDWLGTKSGSFAMAILIFTVLLKLATLNLSIKSYKSMAKMKALQPEILKLQERYADDKMRFSQEQMALFAREKVNPMSGCVPMLIQIPIFFALYKVLFVSIELRQAPFWGWISDMSLPDPTNLFTLFGLIPVTLPSFMPALGAWPLFMGLSMFLQQKMSPQPPDKVQARMFLFMPIFFTFLLSHSPAGLVIYWTWSNLLSIAQQAYIMRRHDVPKSA